MTLLFSELKNNLKTTELSDFILKEQSEETGLSENEIIEKVKVILNSMKSAVKNGLSNSLLSASGLSGNYTSILNNAPNSILISPLGIKAAKYSLAVIEENARMGKIAACPTAGSSGIVPGVLLAAGEEFNKNDDDLIKALMVSGEIGRIISSKVPLAGAVAGCQAECGAASAMASGALCYLSGYDLDTIFNAVALNLKNIMGLTCDPVAGLVEIPCVKRNPFLSLHAITSSYLAMSGIKSLIPVDDVIDAMRETGILMSPKLKESSEAGLAVTKTGLSIKDKLYKIWHAK